MLRHYHSTACTWHDLTWLDMTWHVLQECFAIWWYSRHFCRTGDRRVKSVVFDLLDSDGDGLISVEAGLPSRCANTKFVGFRMAVWLWDCRTTSFISFKKSRETKQKDALLSCSVGQGLEIWIEPELGWEHSSDFRGLHGTVPLLG